MNFSSCSVLMSTDFLSLYTGVRFCLMLDLWAVACAFMTAQIVALLCGLVTSKR